MYIYIFYMYSIATYKQRIWPTGSFISMPVCLSVCTIVIYVQHLTNNIFLHRQNLAARESFPSLSPRVWKAVQILNSCQEIATSTSKSSSFSHLKMISSWYNSSWCSLREYTGKTFGRWSKLIFRLENSDNSFVALILR